MDSWLQYWSLLTLLCCLLTPCGAGVSDQTNGSLSLKIGEKNPGKESAATVLHSLLQKGVLDVSSTRILRSGGEDSFMDRKSWKSKKSHKKPPAQSPATAGGPVSSEGTTGQAKEVSSTQSPLSRHPAKMENESVTCINCGGEMYNEKPPSRSLLSEDDTDNVESVTSLDWALGQRTMDLDFRKSLVKGDRPSVTESQEDSGSGDPHVKNPSDQVTRPGSEIHLHNFMDRETSTPSQTSMTGNITPLIPSTEKAISPDSAEIDHLLQVSRETVLQPPSSSDPHSPNMSRGEVSFEAEKPQGPALEKTSSQSSAQGAKGGTDKTLVTERPQEEFSSTSIPPDGAPKASKPPSDHDIDYDERLEIEDHWRIPHYPEPSFPGGDSTKSIHDKLAPWHKPVHYDDLLPFDETYYYPTPSFYAEGYEVDIEDDNEDDDFEEADDDDDITARGVGDIPKATTVTPKIQTPVVNTKPTGRQDGLFYGEQSPKYNPDINRDQTHSLFGNHENTSECRSGYVKRNNSCKSLCDIYPTYCYNGGQCYIVENTGAFCR
ncbi:chondroitin sulfate proteoglycan 5-like [Hyla sarda]|uniref:chondroitin sulfate proteoglycan 5-like n=1 Tax=Hyla sarda TaxID=327740 RepID=UPI0024C2C629|nr:chondroitin sulfate proteoglycan 5-like [Hyla sarda]